MKILITIAICSMFFLSKAQQKAAEKQSAFQTNITSPPQRSGTITINKSATVNSIANTNVKQGGLQSKQVAVPAKGQTTSPNAK